MIIIRSIYVYLILSLAVVLSLLLITLPILLMHLQLLGLIMLARLAMNKITHLLDQPLVDSVARLLDHDDCTILRRLPTRIHYNVPRSFMRT